MLKFLADGMLGKLTRWLRILGCDVEYASDLADAELLRIAKSQKRVLLTKDFEFYKQAVGRNIETYYLEGQMTHEKLAELAKRFSINLTVDMTTSRCPKCNTPVKEAPKSQIEEKVEMNTLKGYEEFWLCPKCGQVYWQGAHWNKIRETLLQARQHINAEQ